MNEKFLIVGLGNPEKKFENTRHNIGFRIIDEIKNEIVSDQNFITKFNSLFLKCNFDGKEIFLQKPLTYMNNSGEAVSEIVSYYGIENIIVIHDDIDIILEKIKLSSKGSSGGHNGIKSIIAHLRTENFYRVKIGVQQKIEVGEEKIRFVKPDVLGNFSKSEEESVLKIIEDAKNAVLLFLQEGFVKAQNKYN